jgi:hypothetical protein
MEPKYVSSTALEIVWVERFELPKTCIQNTPVYPSAEHPVLIIKAKSEKRNALFRASFLSAFDGQ